MSSLLSSSAFDHSDFEGPLKIALIGCGQITERVYAPILSRLANEVNVAAVCDLDGQRARRLTVQRFPHAGVFTDISSLLDQTRIDAAMVLTSERVNADVAAQILRKGNIPVFLEKPPAISKAALLDLMTDEARSSSCVYTAFNRRHVPLFSRLNLPASRLHRVTGELSRMNREIASFPFTCVHLIDSAQFFGQSLFAETEITFEQNGVSSWTLEGQFESGASCHLAFSPDREVENEFLVFETDDEKWELRFPDIGSVSPRVQLTHENTGIPNKEMARSDGPYLEVMGYAPCIRDFLQEVRDGKLPHSIHRLNSCRRTIEILEAMQMSRDRVLAV